MAVTAAAATGTMTAGTIIAAVSGHAATVPEPKAQVHAEAAPVLAEHLRELSAPVVTVRRGDTLSSIARAGCGSVSDWTGIYVTNKKLIGPDYNLIKPGQVLALDCEAKYVPVRTVTVAVVRGTYRSPRRAYQAPRSYSPGGYSVSSGFQACVIRAESGGNAGIWNASGHWGLYQFSSSTWAAHGGNPADFGRASAAEQTQVFWNTVHADGTSDWAPYDGC